MVIRHFVKPACQPFAVITRVAGNRTVAAGPPVDGILTGRWLSVRHTGLLH